MKWLQELYPIYNDDELQLLIDNNDKKDFENIAEEMGMDKNNKELFK